MLAVDGVPGSVLQALVHGLPVRDQGNVDRLHALAVDQTQRSIARGGDQVVTAFRHQADHFVRGGGGLHVDLAAGFLLELGHPVVVLVAVAAFDVAGPGNDIQAAFAGADFGCLHAGGSQQGSGDGAEQSDLAHVEVSLVVVSIGGAVINRATDF
ncbi:hypothetical protein D3C81_1817980 [compost metagenome]